MNARRLSWQLAIVITLTAPLWHGALGRFLTLEQRSALLEPGHPDARFQMEGIVFRQVKQGTDDLLLHAKRLHGMDEGRGFDLEEAEAKRLGPRPLSITGGSAHYDPDQQILTMQDDVVVQTADLSVKTPAMRYLAKFETIKSAAEVEIVGSGFTITGTSFMYNLSSGDLRVGKRVRCLYTPPV